MTSNSDASSSSTPKIFNEKIFNEEVLTAAKLSFENAEPFHFVRLDNVLSEDILDPLEEQLMGSSFLEQDNDLFRFFQTSDLSGSKSELVKNVVNGLYSQRFRDLVSEVTGTKLNDNTDVTSSVYQPNNMLLCHDDKLMGRKIAFIFYLVPKTWDAAKNGGTLDLFTVNSSGHPDAIAKRLTPVRNTLLMFKVCDHSFHQVAEVIGSDYRLSMGGWFHGPADPSDKPKKQAIVSPPDSNRVVSLPDALEMADVEAAPEDTKDPWAPLRGWINETYLDPSTIATIAKQFEEESFISLQKFLTPEKFVLVQQSLRENKSWTTVGPYNRRHVRLLELVGAAGDAGELVKLARTQAMMRYLKAVTGLDLSGKQSLQVRRFDPGCYELAHDGDPERQETGLDVVLCCVSEEADEKWEAEESGGAMVFADAGDEEPLAYDHPQSNTLTLAYRAEPGTYRFVRYVSHAAPEPRTDLFMTWRVAEEVAEPAAKKVKAGDEP